MSRAVASLVLVAVVAAGARAAGAADVAAVVREMTVELTKKNADPGGWPLPVVSHWANGFNRPKFSSDYQIGLLERGHHVVPTLPFPRPGSREYPADGKPWVEKLARWKAPISLRAGQWESVLYSKKEPADDPGKWRNLPPEKSPLLITREGKLDTWLSPLGAIEPWHEAGVYNTRSGAFDQLQEWYPDPPFVILLSNNEARKVKTKHGLESRSQRYVDRYGTNTSALEQRRAIAEGYVPRYAALLKGIREGLKSPVWRRNALLVGYGAFGPSHFGRWDGWTAYCVTTEDRIDPWHLAWEGSSPSYYTHNWDASTDYRVHSPQVQAMNWVFMLDEVRRERPDHWFEISVWDGNNAGKPKKGSRKKDFYLKNGQTWTSARYAGYVQFGLWLVRPRVVREFRGSTMPLDEFGADFEAMVAGIDRVWADPVLRRFWRRGALVPNRARKHPYQSRIPAKWKDVNRWFLLNTSLDPPGEWTLTTEIPVFSLARVLGEGEEREWLIYAHSPLEDRRGVRLEIPGFGMITADVARGGSFIHVKARDKPATPIASPAR